MTRERAPVILAETHVWFLPALAGFTVSISFVCALGPQNLLLLTQGVRGDRVWTVAAICYGWECLLPVATAAGLVVLRPDAILVLRWLGVGCLLCYGVLAVRAVRHASGERNSGSREGNPVAAAIAVSVGNPPIWVETVVLTGGMLMQFSGPERAVRLGGAWLAGAVRVFGLGFGGRRAAPLLRRHLAGNGGRVVMACAMFGNALVMAAPLRNGV